jgi:hypothetical protein
LAAWGPRALEWTNQRFATFVEKNQGRAQGLPLFLSTASDNASNRQSRHRHVGRPTVAAFGNSTSFGGVNTKHCWLDRRPQIGRESIAARAPTSNSRRDSHTPVNHALTLVSSGRSGGGSADTDVQVSDGKIGSDAGCDWPAFANGANCVASHPRPQQLS